MRCLRKVCDHHDYRLLAPPPRLCTDNAEMVAWNALELLQSGDGDRVIPPSEVPLSLYANAEAPIGEDIRDQLPEKPSRRLRGSSLLRDGPLSFSQSR